MHRDKGRSERFILFFLILKYALTVKSFVSSFFLCCSFLREGSQLIAATKTFLNIVVMDVHAVGTVPHPEKMACVWQERVVTSSLMLLQCLVLTFPVSILAIKLLAHVADFWTLMLLLLLPSPSPSRCGNTPSQVWKG